MAVGGAPPLPPSRTLRGRLPPERCVRRRRGRRHRAAPRTATSPPPPFPHGTHCMQHSVRTAYKCRDCPGNTGKLVANRWHLAAVPPFRSAVLSRQPSAHLPHSIHSGRAGAVAGRRAGGGAGAGSPPAPLSQSNQPTQPLSAGEEEERRRARGDPPRATRQAWARMARWPARRDPPRSAWDVQRRFRNRIAFHHTELLVQRASTIVWVARRDTGPA
eukprot:gene13735-biopygen6560